MLKLDIGSSMESHISHLIAAFFSSRPKGFSTNRIYQYLKLNDYKNNGINIFNLYMSSYKNTEVVNVNEEHVNINIFDDTKSSNITILNEGHVTPTYRALYDIAHC